MGKAERAKGRRRQTQARKILEGLGYEVTDRGLPYLNVHDLDLHVPDGEPPVRTECKGRARFSIQSWLEDAELLVLIPDRASPILAMTPAVLARLLRRRS